MFQFIQGGISKDNRGQIRFVNDFDMKEIKRFYIIKNNELELVRGWRAHKIEKRWFYVIKGSFKFGLVKIDDWSNPSKDLFVNTFVLKSDDLRVAYIPQGYGTAFQAIDDDSELLVFADHYLDHAKFDDYTYHENYFLNWKII
ncbi:WxcM-like domain-containing protein [Sphingobacterium daejeonense]|uniref:WxcM-like domain-containing protein n=1 Tax=Sphingobacterium daejeonense TaxID=371142 RepID=UPI003D316872